MTAMEIGIGTNRRTGGHPAEHGNIEQLRSRRLPEQANAPRLMRVDLDKPGFGERQHMLARHAARGKTKSLADFSEAWGLTVFGDAFADKSQNGGTAGSQVCHGVHLYSCGIFLTSTASRPKPT